MPATFPCGHPQTEANTATRASGQTRCRTCKRAADRKRHQTRPSPVIASALPETWMLDGVCADPHARLAPLFDPLEAAEAGTRDAAERLDAAAALCRTCPVRARCYAHATAHKLVGTWGGHYFSTDSHKENAA